MNLINFRDSSFSAEDLSHYLHEINLDFDPPLITRILNKSDVTSFLDYSKKVLKNGEVVICEKNRKIVGLVVFYINNQKEKVCYIPILSINKNNQKQGIGRKLLSACIETVKAAGFKKIIVDTWETNYPAIRLYQSAGFNISHKAKSTLTFIINF